MKIRKKQYILIGLIVCIGLLFVNTTRAQQTPVYSQYMFNKFLINPAVAGSEGYTAFNLTAREQWLGLKDAPMTHAVSAQTRISPRSWLARLHSIRSRSSKPQRISRVGLGAYLFNDHRGLIDQTGMQITYAYHLPMDEAQLSFGLSFSMVQFSVNKNDLRLENVDDNLVNNSSLKSISPDFSFGAYYTSSDWYAGFSAVQLLQSALKFGDVAGNSFIQRRHYFLMGGYRFAIDRDYSIEPSAFFKSTDQFASQLDIGTRLYYKNDYWGGLAFRTGGWMIFTAGVRYDKFYFGYSFDYGFNKIQSNSYGSHEFMVAYKFGMNIRQYKWLERY
jgi:type IX secretion system PorP/SprF family membrane protein